MSFETKIVIYAASVTEWERDWGTRPDGLVIAKTREAVEAAGRRMDERRSEHGYEYIGEIFAMTPTTTAIELLKDLEREQSLWVNKNSSYYGEKI